MSSNISLHSSLIVRNYPLVSHAEPIKAQKKQTFTKDKTKTYLDLTLREKEKVGPLDHNRYAMILDWKQCAKKGPGYHFHKSHKRIWDKLQWKRSSKLPAPNLYSVDGIKPKIKGVQERAARVTVIEDSVFRGQQTPGY